MHGRNLLLTSLLVLISTGLCFAATAVADSGFHATGDEDPGVMEFDPVSRSLFVLHKSDDQFQGTIKRIEPDGFTVTDTYVLQHIPGSFQYYQPSDYIYYVSIDDEKLNEFDCSTGQVLRSLSLPDVPGRLVLSHDLTNLYVAYGIYPAYSSQWPTPDSVWDERNGRVAKVGRSSFQIALNGISYSGPLWFSLSQDDESLYISNGIPCIQGKMLNGHEIPGKIEDSWVMIEELETSGMAVAREFEAGTPYIGREDGGFAVIGGTERYSHRPTVLANMNTGTLSEIDTSAFTFIDMTQSVVSTAENKAFILMQTQSLERGEEPRKGEIVTVDLTSLATSAYHVGDWWFDDIVYDPGPVGGQPQLILLSIPEEGLYSVSPIP